MSNPSLVFLTAPERARVERPPSQMATVPRMVRGIGDFLNPVFWEWKTPDNVRYAHQEDALERAANLPFSVFERLGLAPSQLNDVDGVFVGQIIMALRKVDFDRQVSSVLMRMHRWAAWAGASSRPAPLALYLMLLREGRLTVTKQKHASTRFLAYLETRIRIEGEFSPMEDFWLEPYELDQRYHGEDRRDGEKGDREAQERYELAKAVLAQDRALAHWRHANNEANLVEGQPRPEGGDSIPHPFLNMTYKRRKLSFIPWLPKSFPRELVFIAQMYNKVARSVACAELVGAVLRGESWTIDRETLLHLVNTSASDVRVQDQMEAMWSAKRRRSGEDRDGEDDEDDDDEDDEEDVIAPRARKL